MTSINTQKTIQYICPICIAISGVENDDTLLKQDDLVFRDELASVWINSFWVGKNAGHVIIVPNVHYENMYDLPKQTGHRIFDISQMLASALKETYKCDGITLRQNNESAGDQHAFHYHLHIYPRYLNDDFNRHLAEKATLASPEERSVYAERIRQYLGRH